MALVSKEKMDELKAQSQQARERLLGAAQGSVAHVRMHTIVCPWCGHQYQEPYEYPDVGDMKCIRCDKPFEYYRDVIYTTEPLNDRTMPRATKDSRIASDATGALASGNGSACLWLCSELSRSDDGIPKPKSDDDGSRVTAKIPITAETAAEIVAETSDREMSDGDELAVWVWQPGDVTGAKEYFIRVSWSWNFSARPND